MGCGPIKGSRLSLEYNCWNILLEYIFIANVNVLPVSAQHINDMTGQTHAHVDLHR